MNPWPFVAAAYAVAILATVVLVAVALAGMHRAEKAADEIGKR